MESEGGFVPAYEAALLPSELDRRRGDTSPRPNPWVLPGPPPPRGAPLSRPGAYLGAGSGRSPKVWISLTTLPGRIAQIERTVLSLVRQTVAPDEVVLSVPEHSAREGTAYGLPAWLEALVAASNAAAAAVRVRVRRIEHDFGPATKLIPSVQEARALGEDVLVLVVDDDTLYPPRLLETLLEWHRRLPGAALAFSGWPVVRGTLRYPHWSENYLVYGNEVFAPHPVSVVRGNCGYLVRTSFFDEALWEGYAAAPPGAFYMDDVWISGRLAAAGVRRFVVPFDEDQFTMTPNLENVTTLDHVSLDRPSDHQQELLQKQQQQQQQQQAAAAGAAASAGGGGSASAPAAAAAPAVAVQPRARPQKPVAPPGGSNRVQANEQALQHFKKAWDVFWDGENYKIIPEKQTGDGRKSWLGGF